MTCGTVVVSSDTFGDLRRHYSLFRLLPAVRLTLLTRVFDVCGTWVWGKQEEKAC